MTTRKRQGGSDSFAGLPRDLVHSAGTLALQGSHALILADEAAAASLHAEQHMLPWGDQSTCDRFDARLLLDPSDASSLESRGLAGVQVADPQEQDPQLDYERFRDLPAEQEQEEADLNGAGSQEHADASDQEEDDEPQPLLPPPRRPAGYNAVGFDYGQTAPAAAGAADLSAEAAATAAQARPQQQPPGEQGADKPFVPTFLVPHHLREHLPSLERMHKVIMQTAKFVRGSGGQTEFVLRVKQAGNPNFRFLDPEDRLHSYFRWLVETNPQDIVRQDAQEAAQHTPAAEPAAAAPQQEASPEVEAQQPASSSEMVGEVPAGHSGAEEGQPAHCLPPVSGSGAPQAHLGLPAASSAPYQVAPVGMQPGFGPRMLPPHGRPLRPMPFLGMLPMRPGHHAAAAAEPSQRPGSPEPEVPGMEPAAKHASAAPTASPTSATGSGPATPPPEILGIIDRLAAFIKKAGPQFEATVRMKEKGNPRFAFMLPWNMYHEYYRQQLMSVLGKEMAQQVFNPPAATPSQTAPTPAASSLAPAAGDAELDELHSQADRAIPSTQSAEQLGGSSGRKRKFTLQANPSLASTAKGDGAAEQQADEEAASAQPAADANAQEHDAQQPSADAPAATPATQAEAAADTEPAQQLSGDSEVPQQAKEEGTQEEGPAEGETGTGLSIDAVLEAQRAVAQEKQQRDSSLSEAQKKEQRRKLAREMLAARKLASAREEQEERWKQQSALARYRRQFSADSESDGEGMAAEAKPAEEPEPGEILAAAVPKPEELQLLAPRDSLPKLEELIAATTGPSVDPVSEHAVLSDPDAPVDVSPKRRRSRSRDSTREREHRRHKRHKQPPRSSHRFEASGDEQPSPERRSSREHSSRHAPHKQSRTEASGAERGSPERQTSRERSSRRSRQKRSRHSSRHGSEQLSDGASTDTGREHRSRWRKSKRRRRSRSPAAALDHDSPHASGGTAASADLRARVRAMLGQL